jgi:hypothetical protein
MNDELIQRSLQWIDVAMRLLAPDAPVIEPFQQWMGSSSDEKVREKIRSQLNALTYDWTIVALKWGLPAPAWHAVLYIHGIRKATGKGLIDEDDALRAMATLARIVSKNYDSWNDLASAIQAARISGKREWLTIEGEAWDENAPNLERSRFDGVEFKLDKLFS